MGGNHSSGPKTGQSGWLSTDDASIIELTGRDAVTDPLTLQQSEMKQLGRDNPGETTQKVTASTATTHLQATRSPLQ